jgi:hypothetical protein
VPEERFDASAIHDPEGKGPRIYFQRVPQPKIGKTRLHVDVNAGGPRETPDGERRRNIDAEVKRLRGLGASVLRAGEVSELGEY